MGPVEFVGDINFSLIEQGAWQHMWDRGFTWLMTEQWLLKPADTVTGKRNRGHGPVKKNNYKDVTEYKYISRIEQMHTGGTLLFFSFIVSSTY